MLKELLKQQSISIQDLSNLTSIPISTLEQYLKEDDISNDEDLAKIAKSLNIDETLLKQKLLLNQLHYLKQQNRDIKKNTMHLFLVQTILIICTLGLVVYDIFEVKNIQIPSTTSPIYVPVDNTNDHSYLEHDSLIILNQDDRQVTAKEQIELYEENKDANYLLIVRQGDQQQKLELNKISDIIYESNSFTLDKVDQETTFSLIINSDNKQEKTTFLTFSNINDYLTTWCYLQQGNLDEYYFEFGLSSEWIQFGSKIESIQVYTKYNHQTKGPIEFKVTDNKSDSFTISDVIDLKKGGCLLIDALTSSGEHYYYQTPSMNKKSTTNISMESISKEDFEGSMSSEIND